MHTSYFEIGVDVMMKFDDKEFIAQVIKKYRIRNKLTQEKLAELTDITNQHMSRIECGCYIPSLTTFFMLAQILKIDLREFGFNAIETENEVKNKLISQIISADNAQLALYESLINSVNSTLPKVKREIIRG